MAAEVLPIALDNASNIKIFEKLAPPHLINAQRLEDVKDMNHVSDLPVGRHHPHVSIQSGGASPPPLPAISTGGDSIDAILADGMAAHARRTSPPARSEVSEQLPTAMRMDGSPHPPPPSPARSQASVASVGIPPLSQVSAPSPPAMAMPPRPDLGVAGPPLPTGFSEVGPNPAQAAFENDVRAAMAAGTPPPQGLPPLGGLPGGLPPPPMLQPEPPRGAFANEYDRIRANVNQPGYTVEDMHRRYDQRKAARPAPPPHYAANYAELYHEACRTRQAHMGGGGGYRPSADPDYAEKKELLIKLDELRHMGFSVPTYDMSMPLEDLQSEVHRRTMSQGTISTLNSAIGWINGFAGFVQMVNDAAGPFLPMENYAKNVKEGTSTPRFKYALYQIILRWRGRSGMNPWTEIITILLIPLIEGIAIKIAQWVLKGRKGLLNANTAKAGIQSMFKFMRPNPTEGVPSGIAGVSADTPAKPAPAPPMGFPAPTPGAGAFGGNFPKARDYAAEQAAAPPSRPTPSTPKANKKKKKRLMTPQEVHEMNARKHPPAEDEMSGLVVTDEQRDAGMV